MISSRPIIGITMGDPAGVGPEIIVKTLVRKWVYDQSCPLAVADARVMSQAVKIALKDLEIHPIAQASDGRFEHGVIDVIHVKCADLSQIKHGKVSAIAGRAAGRCIEKAVEMAMQGEIDAVVTAPIHKESFQLAGYDFPGHTEFLAHLTGAEKYTMMLAHDNLRVVHVSTHVSLRKALDLVKRGRILDVIRIANDACHQLGIKQPRIAVAGLNPHASDGGLFGTEESEEIVPAVEDARGEGMVVEGPISPDIVFARAWGGQCDIVVAMFHDQGHIPLKLVGFSWSQRSHDWDEIHGVNITFGLPIIRTSVDHGVAFGKAGKGTASPDSMEEAIRVAIQLARVRRGLS